MESLYFIYYHTYKSRALLESHYCSQWFFVFCFLFFFLGGGAEKRNRSKAGNRHLYYLHHHYVPPPISLAPVTRNPRFISGRKKKKTMNSRCLLGVDKSLPTPRAHGFSCRSLNGLILDVGALVVDVAASAKERIYPRLGGGLKHKHGDHCGISVNRPTTSPSF